MKPRLKFAKEMREKYPREPGIHPSVNIPEWVKIGERVTIHEGCTIGTEGFGFERDINGCWLHIPHVGGTIIGDDVEIMSGTNVDRGTVENTIIASGVKIDHNCHIAHNSFVGENSVITAGVVVAGSAHIGKNVWIGPGSTILNKIKIGDNAYIGAGANVIKDVPENAVMIGNPAIVLRYGRQPHMEPPSEFVKVWSHRRSGTNFLCGLLYVNFYDGWMNPGAVDDDPRGKEFVTQRGDIQHHNEWADLFGGHEIVPPGDFKPGRDIYIKRNVLDTAFSCYNAKFVWDFVPGFKGFNENMSFDEFLATKFPWFDTGLMTVVDRIKLHHANWEKAGVYIVNYEDLVADPITVLKQLAERFDLTPLTDFKTLDRLVGWSPKAGKVGEGEKHKTRGNTS